MTNISGILSFSLENYDKFDPVFHNEDETGNVVYPHCCNCDHTMQLLCKPYYNEKENTTYYNFICRHDDAGNSLTLNGNLWKYDKEKYHEHDKPDRVCKCHNHFYILIRGKHNRSLTDK